MPWIKNADGERFVTPAHKGRRMPLPPGIKETDPQAHAQRSREHDERFLFAKRLPMEWFKCYENCPRKSCRRQSRCTSPTVACCTDEVFNLLKREFYPELMRGIRAAKAQSVQSDGAAGDGT